MAKAPISAKGDDGSDALKFPALDEVNGFKALQHSLAGDLPLLSDRRTAGDRELVQRHDAITCLKSGEGWSVCRAGLADIADQGRPVLLGALMLGVVEKTSVTGKDQPLQPAYIGTGAGDPLPCDVR